MGHLIDKFETQLIGMYDLELTDIVEDNISWLESMVGQLGIHKRYCEFCIKELKDYSQKAKRPSKYKR